MHSTADRPLSFDEAVLVLNAAKLAHHSKEDPLEADGTHAMITLELELGDHFNMKWVWPGSGCRLHIFFAEENVEAETDCYGVILSSLIKLEQVIQQQIIDYCGVLVEGGWLHVIVREDMLRQAQAVIRNLEIALRNADR